jgi:hypothetical protein
MLFLKSNSNQSLVKDRMLLFRSIGLERRLLSFVSEAALERQVVFRVQALRANQTKADKVRQGNTSSNKMTGGCVCKVDKLKKEKEGKQARPSCFIFPVAGIEVVTLKCAVNGVAHMAQ